jgi:hypothetical protein
VAKLVYKIVAPLVSVLGGLLAAVMFKKVWKLTAGEDEAPRATDADRGWPEVLAAAALQGALFAVVRAVMDRTAAAGAKKLTGTWPGEEGRRDPGKDAG